MDNAQDRDTLGRAANRYVTFQIVAAIIGGIIFLILLFTVFLPRFNRVERMVTSHTTTMPGDPLASGVPMPEGTFTVNGRPATPEERQEIERAVTGGSP